jgi:hypothetical protein
MAHTCKNPNHKSIEDCYEAFKRVAFARGDDTVLTLKMDQYECELIRLKMLIIRLRRRGEANDAREFGRIWQTNWQQYVPLFDSRWLVSVLETLADYGPPSARAHAMLVASNVTWERWAQTLAISAYITRSKNPVDKVGQKPIYDGLMTQQLKWADTPTNYFERTMQVLYGFPYIKSVFVELTKRQLDEPKSILSQLCLVSDWDMKGSILSKIERK